MKKHLLLIIPCYNEELRLPISQFVEFIESHIDYDFCFVNDGSTDKTQEILDNLAKEAENKWVIQCPKNLGKAEAIRFAVHQFLPKKNYEFVGYWDADLAVPLEVTHDLLNVFKQNPKLSMVIGSRVKLMGYEIERKAYRHYLGRIFATLVSIILKLDIYDTQCGSKIIKSDLATKIFAEPFITSWFFDVELFARIILLMGKAETEKIIHEFPLKRWVDIDGSKLKITDFLKTPYLLSKIFLYIKQQSRLKK